MSRLTVPSAVGPLTIVQTGEAITSLDWGGTASDDTPLLRETARQLAAYFDGQLTRFDLPLEVQGSDFQRDICDAISAIPYGVTRTYGDIAAELDVPAQAVGQGCGGNPIPILLPCHRVLAATGLGGFSGRGGIEAGENQPLPPSPQRLSWPRRWASSGSATAPFGRDGRI